MDSADEKDGLSRSSSSHAIAMAVPTPASPPATSVATGPLPPPLSPDAGSFGLPFILNYWKGSAVVSGILRHIKSWCRSCDIRSSRFHNSLRCRSLISLTLSFCHPLVYHRQSDLPMLCIVTLVVCGVPCAEFDLESSRSEMDEQGLRVAEHQESSLKNRRKLAEATRGTCSCHC